MPTPDASQYTRFRRYASIAGDALTSGGSKISPFNTSYSIPMISASSQALFLPSANKVAKFSESAQDSYIGRPNWIRELGNGNGEVLVYGITTDPNDGTVIVCGETYQELFGGTIGDTFSSSKAFVARYTKSGTFIDGATLGSGLNTVGVKSVTTDVHGNIYVCGDTLENLQISDTTYATTKGFCAKFSPIFELVWVAELGSGLQSTNATAILASPDGYVYIGGNTRDTDWNDTNPHDSFAFDIGYVVCIDPTTGLTLSGTEYGSGVGGGTFIRALIYLPIIGGLGPPEPLIAIAGESRADLEFPEFNVPNPGAGGVYGFVAFTYFDLYPLGAIGIGSGDNTHETLITCMTLVTLPEVTFVYIGGSTNEYLDGPDQYSLLAGGGRQGFVTVFAFSGPGGFAVPITIGDEQNYTTVSGVTFNNQKLGIGGYTNENLDTGVSYGDALVTFTLEADAYSQGFIQPKQIGTATSIVILQRMASDTFGNFYVGGFSLEHLPSGPSIPGLIGYISKVSDQPKTYNTPIFMSQDVSYNDVNGYVMLEFTPPVTIDWGDGTTQTITNGSAGGFTHLYNTTGIYNIVIDVKTGGEITFFRAENVGIQRLDVSRCPTLLFLRCDGNFLKNLNVSGCPNLETLICDNNQLVSLDVSGLSSLDDLQFEGGDNFISTIHLEGCGLTGTTTKSLEGAITELDNNNDNPGRIYLYANQETTYFEGDAAEYFSAQLPAWTFIIIPDPPPVVVADLSGLIFDGTGDPGHNYSHAFTFPSTNTVKVTFTNAPVSINQITHLQFQGPDGTIAPGDTFTVKNPTLTPSVASQDVGGNVYLYTNGSFPLTPSSEITLTTANSITGVTFSMN